MIKKWLSGFIGAAVAVLMLGSFTFGQEPSFTEVWDGRGTDSLACDKAGEFGRPATGWIHWIFSTKGSSTGAKLTLGGTGTGTYSPDEPLDSNVWHFYTPFFELDELTAKIDLFGGSPGPGGGLVISDYCPGLFEQLTVTKTAETSYVRTHAWSIEKSVDPNYIYLYADGSGDKKATWTVDVTYDGFEDSGFKVDGVITIANTGTLPAVIESIVDILGGDEIGIDCEDELPFVLEVGETFICTYSAKVDDQDIDLNTVIVTTEAGNIYGANAEVVWSEPSEEINACVEVVDFSDLFGCEILGEVCAGDNATFTYSKDFAWEDYGRENCGDFEYENTAQVIGDNDKILDSADAILKVYVQCLIFQGETAWVANGNVSGQLRYTRRGNWATYVAYAEKTTTIFAGQTIPVGTATFSPVVGGQVTITIELDGGWEFAEVAESLKVQDYAAAPSGNPSPGLFAHKSSCGGDSCKITVPANNFYGVHLDVGLWVPDPDFGP